MGHDMRVFKNPSIPDPFSYTSGEKGRNAMQVFVPLSAYPGEGQLAQQAGEGTNNLFNTLISCPYEEQILLLLGLPIIQIA